MSYQTLKSPVNDDPMAFKYVLLGILKTNEQNSIPFLLITWIDLKKKIKNNNNNNKNITHKLEYIILFICLFFSPLYCPLFSLHTLKTDKSSNTAVSHVLEDLSLDAGFPWTAKKVPSY